MRFVGFAGKLKEGELSDEAKKAAVKEFDFKKGILVALFSGVASAGTVLIGESDRRAKLFLFIPGGEIMPGVLNPTNPR